MSYQNNINLFSTFFPSNYKILNKKILSKNTSTSTSPTHISNEVIKCNNNIYKKINEDNFVYNNSGRFKNINNINSSLSLLNKNKKLPNKIYNIPSIKVNNNHLDFNYNMNKNLSSNNIKYNNNKAILYLDKNINDPNYLDKNNIIFNKKRNYFSKESINLLKFLNYKNLYSKLDSHKINKINNDSISNESITSLNNNNDNICDIQVINRNQGLNNYLTVYNFKSFILDKNPMPIKQKSHSKINTFTNKNFIQLPKMIEKSPNIIHKNMKLNTIYTKVKNNMKTYFPNNNINNINNEMLIQNTMFNKTKVTNYNNLKKQFKIKKIKNNSKIQIEALSIPGKTYNKEKINQDTYMILPNNILSKNKNLSEFTGLNVFGIFDGHGEFGDIISNEVKNYFIEYFNNLDYNSNENFEKICKNNYKEIYSLFNQIDKKLHIKYNSKKTCYNSGTTANLILLFKNKIITINVGDSKSILISGNNNDIIQLNTCHNPEKEEEKKRIEKNGGEVGRVNWADYGPQRVWYKGRVYPGLSISRSFGDFISEPLGVFSIPDIKQFDIDYKTAKIIVIATDGIWEFLSNEKVRDIIMPYYNENNIHGCIYKLIDMASKIWNIKNPKYIDDLSVILLFFK